MKLYAIIMAGGSGTRFWPASRKKNPKQLLPLGPSERALLVDTAERLLPIIARERIYVATSELLSDRIAELLPDLPREQILAEPVGRNTAPCIGWAASILHERDPDAVLAVMPSDHIVQDLPALHRAIELAELAAKGGSLVTMGIRPTRPETGFGYLEMGEELAPGVHRALRFIEKPDLDRAVEFYRSSHYLWNAGMFFFQARTILDAIDEFLPELGEGLRDIGKARGTPDELKVLRERFATLPEISIDHGVMERASNVAVIPVSCGWSDLGSWQAAWELADKDENDNVLPEGAIAIDSSGCYAIGKKDKVLAIVGMKDMVIVDTDDALLILPRNRSQDVRAIVEELKARGDSRF
ncbi:MAG: mannose-6-phosphate isomerase [Sandaracinaceae bacterium]|nr:mannose-6-phosphate isomerase [Sandaracinaceae bacterium]